MINNMIDWYLNETGELRNNERWNMNLYKESHFLKNFFNFVIRYPVDGDTKIKTTSSYCILKTHFFYI